MARQTGEAEAFLEDLYLFPGRQVPGGFHPLENHFYPVLCGLPVEIRRVEGRSFGESGQEGHFRPVQFCQFPAKIGLGGGLHPVGAVTKIDLVEVHLQDLLFSVV